MLYATRVTCGYRYSPGISLVTLSSFRTTAARLKRMGKWQQSFSCPWVCQHTSVNARAAYKWG